MPRKRVKYVRVRRHYRRTPFGRVLVRAHLRRVVIKRRRRRR